MRDSFLFSVVVACVFLGFGVGVCRFVVVISGFTGFGVVIGGFTGVDVVAGGFPGVDVVICIVVVSMYLLLQRSIKTIQGASPKTNFYVLGFYSV